MIIAIKVERLLHFNIYHHHQPHLSLELSLRTSSAAVGRSLGSTASIDLITELS